MKVRKVLPGLLTLFLVIFAAPILRADTLNAALVDSSLSGALGTSVTFSVMISNPSNTDTFLNSANVALTDLPLSTLDTTPFFNNAPFFIAPTHPAVTFDTLTIFLDPTLLSTGTFSGFFAIEGGANGGSFNLLADLPFTVKITSNGVPEPGTLQMLLLGLALAGAVSLSKLRFG